MMFGYIKKKKLQKELEILLENQLKMQSVIEDLTRQVATIPGLLSEITEHKNTILELERQLKERSK